ncbi:MAG: OCRE domain-containing protein [Bacillota bacterium]
MKNWYKIVIPVVIAAATVGGYLIFSKPQVVTQPAKNNQVQELVDGYIYDEQTGRYINKTTGVWYIVKDGYKVIPPEEYFDPDKIGIPSGINISNRPNDVWELKEIREITIKSGDTLVDIINPYFMNEHFRMNYEWYAKQVLKLNNIIDPHFIKALDTLKIPIYIDKEAK